MAAAYAGERRDPLTGCQHHRKRWMTPELGGWLLPDSVFDFPGNFGHERAYASLDPANRIDPLGTFSLGEINLTAVLQSYVISHVGGTFGEAILKAFFTAAGIDPAVFSCPSSKK